MKRALLYSILLMSLIVLLDNDTRAQPQLSVLGGIEHNWGEMPPGTLYVAKRIVNSGTDTLEILGIKRSCGCTTAPIDKTKLVAGDTATLNVSIDAMKQNGEQERTIALKTNDVLNPVTTLTFLADIKRDLITEPRSFPTIMGVKPGRTVTTDILITNTGADTVYFAEPVLEIPEQQASFTIHEGDRILPGETLPLGVSITTDSPGFFVGSVLIRSSSKYVPQFEVNIQYRVREPIASDQK